MSSNFKPEELVKVSGKSYPVVGGRLRLAHEESTVLNIETSVITYDGEKAIIQAKVTTDKGTFNGLGNATITRDAKLKNAILELAETRAIARALRFAGYGVEFTGFEEMPSEHDEPEPKQKQAEQFKYTGPQKDFSSDEIKPNKTQMEAVAALALKKGVNLALEGRNWTGKSTGKEWTMSDYTKVANKLEAMADVAS